MQQRDSLTFIVHIPWKISYTYCESVKHENNTEATHCPNTALQCVIRRQHNAYNNLKYLTPSFYLYFTSSCKIVSQNGS